MEHRKVRETNTVEREIVQKKKKKTRKTLAGTRFLSQDYRQNFNYETSVLTMRAYNFYYTAYFRDSFERERGIFCWNRNVEKRRCLFLNIDR